jgi:hypothetical protein
MIEYSHTSAQVFNHLFARGRISQDGIFASNGCVTYFVLFCLLQMFYKCYGQLIGLMKN